MALRRRQRPRSPRASKLTFFTQKADGSDLVLSAHSRRPDEVDHLPPAPNGWLTIDYAYNLTGPHAYFGIGFDYPEAKVQSMRYLGNGPAPVFQNRLAGGALDVWDKKYNNTMVGDPDDLAAGEHFDYPVFKGYYAGVRWLQLGTSEGPITALLNQDDLYVQVFTPKMPPANIRMNASTVYANAGISFLHAIATMGNKFGNATTTGPQGQPAVAKGDYKGSISICTSESFPNRERCGGPYRAVVRTERLDATVRKADNVHDGQKVHVPERPAMEVNIVDVRENLAEVVNRVAYGGERVVLRRRKKSVAAVVSMEDLQLLQGLEDQDDVKAALRARKEKGTVPLEKVKARLGMK